MRGRNSGPGSCGTGLTTLILAGCYTLGALAGAVYAKGLEGESLTETLTQTLAAVESGGTPTAWLPLVWRCVRLPGAAALLGFSLLGILTIPGLCLAEGFSLAFSVSAFLRAYGQPGLIPALAVFGFGSLVGGYILLLVGGWSLPAACRLWQGVGQGNRPQRPERQRVLTVLALFALRLAAERWAVVPLLSAALEKV